VGGSRKLDFTFIGDRVNVAGRVEQLTDGHQRPHPRGNVGLSVGRAVATAHAGTPETPG
jgi:class 3 adenylate cyclase